jgi:hypothetical protein
MLFFVDRGEEIECIKNGTGSTAHDEGKNRRDPHLLNLDHISWFFTL